mgnify:CR=1 FL=1
MPPKIKIRVNLGPNITPIFVKLKKVPVLLKVKVGVRGIVTMPNNPSVDENMIDIVAAEDVLAGDVITSDGFIADSNNLLHRGRIAGIAKSDTLTGFTIPVQTGGKITIPSWSWTNGQRLFLNQKQLNPIPGNSSNSFFLQSMGLATGAQTIIIEVEESIKL